MNIRSLYRIVLAIPLLLLASCAVSDREEPRSSDISSEVKRIAENNPVVESFIVDYKPAVSYHLGKNDGPQFNYVELLGGMNGYYALSRGPVLSDSQIAKVNELLLDRKHYTDDELICIFGPEYALRFSSSGKKMVVFLGTDCRMIQIVNETGDTLDRGTIKAQSARRWSQFLESL